MNSIIEVTEQEAQENFDFLFNLVCRGSSVKIIRENGTRVMMVPLPTYKEATAFNPPIGGDFNLPTDPEAFVDPVGTRDYVSEQLREMQTELES
jgi:hypothetical protein